ncbi:hypothetical protein EJ05DRAFT_166217 [Pseudovirgaria hyperparasitica]|uniref:Uncharacterized protein n=1 Tax=Pseudovirgaria hyperparasitica TaxID=470096 RepID=A0A6A6VSQ7_9PEZI|nr:uncharacterized protein EJ05DRAFT_166217 [Pseudovirgaria hyperparasitica]KAF2753622.1 hypothetical protein EJ05DRAFT_166217 [Pseudovirgaria hyperparasitica]
MANCNHRVMNPTDSRQREIMRAWLRAGNRMRDGVHNPDPNDERYKFGHNSTGNRYEDPTWRRIVSGQPSHGHRRFHQRAITDGRESATYGGLHDASFATSGGHGSDGLVTRLQALTIGTGTMDGQSSMMRSSRQGPSLGGVQSGRSFAAITAPGGASMRADIGGNMGSYNAGGTANFQQPSRKSHKDSMMASSRQGPSLGNVAAGTMTMASDGSMMRSSRQGPSVGIGDSFRGLSQRGSGLGNMSTGSTMPGRRRRF